MQAAQLIHSSHLPLSADNSPARHLMPARPVFISTAFLPDGACERIRSLFRREFLCFPHVVFGN